MKCICRSRRESIGISGQVLSIGPDHSARSAHKILDRFSSEARSYLWKVRSRLLLLQEFLLYSLLLPEFSCRFFISGLNFWGKNKAELLYICNYNLPSQGTNVQVKRKGTGSSERKKERERERERKRERKREREKEREKV